MVVYIENQMGQYLKGRKIGTCESMYYMRMEEAQKLAEQGARDDDGIKFSDYLSDNETKWRFPFPDEDKGIPADCKYDRSINLPANGIEIEHRDICVGNSHHNGGYNVNIFIPCPYSKEFQALGLRTSTGGAGEQFFSVVMEAMRDQVIDGKTVRVRKTVFKCARCEAMFRLSDDDVTKLKERAKEYFAYLDKRGKNPAYAGDQDRYDYAMEVLNRIY